MAEPKQKLPEVILAEENAVRLAQGLKPYPSVKRMQIEAWKSLGRKCEVCGKEVYAKNLIAGITEPICKAHK